MSSSKMASSSEEDIGITDLGTGSVHETALKIGSLNVENSTEHKPTAPRQEITYIQGWRFHLLSFAIGLCVFLVNMEVSIVSTSLVSMTNEFHGFDESTWVITAYLATYTGFLIIWGRLSDVFGRKWTYVATNFIFLAFSAGCGAAQSMLQLIICRAFQGLGASGAFSVSLTIFYEFIPPPKYPLYGSFISLLSTVGALVGPLVGGAIDTTSTWRWVFFLNVFGTTIILGLVIFLLPGKFPYHGSSASSANVPWQSLLKRVDFVGAFLLLSASVLVITALLEVSTVFTWSSAATVCLLTISGLIWVGFIVWEWFVGSSKDIQEPMFPRVLLENRTWMGIALTSFLVGIPSQIITIEIPQKAQAVYGDSPWQAGYRLIAYTLAVPVGSIVANTIIGKTKIPPIYLLFCGTAIQVLGVGLLLTAPASGIVPGQIHFFEALIAFGVGSSFAILLILNPHCIERQYIATASGAVVQFRMTGSTLGLASVTTALNNHLSGHLPKILNDTQLKSVLSSTSAISSLEEPLKAQVQEVFGQGYDLQLKILIGFTAAQFLTLLLIWNWKRPQMSIHKTEGH
ncbi:uncharacterized protein EAE98_000277 [Botrytis deweyae]|uniref:Major facilitator superfamily (MFS) profile domain-containing protein n=1 Tax=Botrytis deweyae TaxID=2478750 RepID=A0ABQ7J298_9HELO|nr:uncharacterized protein EAE98_000277 [Botrytis deweyae]KAF7940150.1 hypothetical protein EAE98_000277 [Botrytis deweyae]